MLSRGLVLRELMVEQAAVRRRAQAVLVVLAATYSAAAFSSVWELHRSASPVAASSVTVSTRPSLPVETAAMAVLVEATAVVVAVY
jgi:hypothetical protein